MLVNPEDGIRILDAGESKDLPAPALPSSVPEVIKAILAGTLPRDPGWQPRAGTARDLNATHIAMIMERSLGYTSKEIAAKFEVAEHTVSYALNHPDAQVLMAAIFGTLSDQVTDVHERIKGYAHEALSALVLTLRTTQEESIRVSAAKDLLDRAGYGARRQVDVRATARFELPAETASRVSEAASEARRVASADYNRFLRSQSQEGGSSSAIAAAVSAEVGGSALPAVDEASLSDDSSEAAAA